MRMNRIILASHGGLSAGMKDTVQMILGELPNLYALATLRDETEPITVAARRLLDGFAAEDAVYIVTDVMGEMCIRDRAGGDIFLDILQDALLDLALVLHRAVQRVPVSYTHLCNTAKFRLKIDAMNHC